MRTVTISMPDSLREYVEAQVAARGYGNVSEFFRDLIREDRKRAAEKKLEGLLLEGLESGGPDIEVDERFWKELRDEAQELIRKHKSK